MLRAYYFILQLRLFQSIGIVEKGFWKWQKNKWEWLGEWNAISADHLQDALNL